MKTPESCRQPRFAGTLINRFPTAMAVRDAVCVIARRPDSLRLDADCLGNQPLGFWPGFTQGVFECRAGVSMMDTQPAQAPPGFL